MVDKTKLTNDNFSEMYIEDVIDRIWKYKYYVIGIALLFGTIGAITSLILTEKFESHAALIPTTMPAFIDNSRSSGLNLGSVSALLGSRETEVSNTQKNLAILNSRKFLYSFFEENNLLYILFKDHWDAQNKVWTSDEDRNTNWFAYNLFLEDNMTISVDRVSGVVKLVISYEDPVLAQEWAEKLIKKLNQYVRDKSLVDSNNSISFLEAELVQTSVIERRRLLFNMIEQETRKKMFASVTEEFAFSIIDPPVVPELRSSPKRALMTILSTIFGGIIGSFAMIFRKVKKKA